MLWLLGAPPLDGGRQWFDLSGLRPGVLSGVTWAGGPYGSAAVNGPGSSATTEGVTVADAGGGLAGMSQLTVAGWARATGFGGSGFGRILTQNDTSGYAMLFPGGGGLGLSVGGTSITGGTAAADGLWHRWVGTYDGATVRLYYDAVQIASGAKTGAVPSSTAGVVVGNRAAGSRGWAGQLADVGIWTRALSAAEVLADCDLSRRGYPGVLRRR